MPSSHSFPSSPDSVLRASGLEADPPSPVGSVISAITVELMTPSRFSGASPRMAAVDLTRKRYSYMPASSIQSTSSPQLRYRFSDESVLIHDIAELETALGNDHPAVLSKVLELSSIFEQQGRLKAAEHTVRRVVAVSRKHYGENHENTAQAYKQLGFILSEQSDFGDARRFLDKSLKLLTALMGPTHPDTMDNIIKLAALNRRESRHLEAESSLIDVLQICLEEPSRHIITDRASLQLALVYTEAGKKLAKLESLVSQIISSRAQPGHPNFADTIAAMSVMADAKCYLGDREEARRLCEEAVKCSIGHFGTEHPEVLFAVQRHGELYIRRREFAKAENIFTDALQTVERVMGVNHQRTLNFQYNIALALSEQGKYDQAVAMCQKGIGNLSSTTLSSFHYDFKRLQKDCLWLLSRAR